MNRNADLLVVNENMCECGHLAEEHYTFESEERKMKPTHCDVDGCLCELFATEHL
jgi:hypothetical protein